ncbi:conjugal transfer protein TrbH [Devosia neptuniae]|uniref:conjugal transfer protein TrbH n=1 Tax=Devosia neptuniae TaxID=191302 RepID=UPI0022AE8932|nr:conjugal transfer protein TrbH [Devosia neptuniae]MCZ4348099.1 conjugal transfer protein TrbH [Devosia neptuniae]
MNVQISSALRALGFIAAALPLAGCQTFGIGGSSSQIVSVDNAQVSPEAAGVIAEDLVGSLAEVVGPGTGTIVLKPDDSAFAVALEKSLRAWGYAVAVDQKVEVASAIPVAFTIDSFDGSVLARLSTSAVDLGRAYALTETGATPTSPLSVLQRA